MLEDGIIINERRTLTSTYNTTKRFTNVENSEIPLRSAFDAPPFVEDQSGDFFSSMEEPEEPFKSEMRSTTAIDGYPHADGYYWFGQLFHRCLLAEIVLRDAKVPLQGRASDAALNTALRTFPYAQCLARINEIKIPAVGIDGAQHSGGPEEILMVKIGAAIHRGDGGTKREIANRIWSCASKSHPVVDHWQNNRPPSPPDSDSEQTEIRQPETRRFTGGATGRDSPNKAVVQPGAYMTRLMEWSQKHEVYVVAKDAVQLDEQLFEVTIVVNGKPFTGTRKSKKEARHDASRKACDHLGIA